MKLQGIDDNVVSFASVALGIELYPWQARVCDLIDYASTHSRVKVAVVCPNGAGKTTMVVATNILRWLSRYPKGKVVLTSADGKQIDSQLMPALHTHRSRFPSWEFLARQIRTPEGGFLLAFSTREASRAEGHHAGPDSPLMIICDEAKSVDEAIFASFDRCSYNVQLLISSPGIRGGRFYRAFTDNRAQFFPFEITLKDCPHISEERIADTIETYGETNSFTRSTIYGEFMTEADGVTTVISYDRLMALIATPPHPRLTNELVAFCDFAAGGDENVLAIRRGNKLAHLVAWKDRDTTAGVGRFIVEFRRSGLDAKTIWGDEGGGGRQMCDMLREAGWPINRFNFGAKAFNTDAYISRGAEIWHNFGQMIERGECVLLNDPILISQLTTRKTTYDSRGRQGVEKKDDMRARGLHSPDRADAVVGVFGISIKGWHNFSQKPESVFDWDEYAEGASSQLVGLERQLKEDRVWTG
jgi:hypothetical protein